eukprot:5673079-Amphidinium_carterae.2
MATWEEVTIAGNATLRLASRLLPVPWLLSLPLDDPGSQSGQYCEAIIVALHVAGIDPAGAVTAVVLAVPDGVSSEIADVQVATVSAYHPASPDDVAEDLLVGLVVADPSFIANKLTTTTSSEVEMIAFSDPPGVYPKAGELFTVLNLNDLLSQGSLVHLDVTSAAVRVHTDGYESEGAYHSATELEGTDMSLVITQLSSLGTKRRRVRGKSSSPFLLGLGASTSRMSDLVQSAKAKTAGGKASPRPKVSGKAAVPPISGTAMAGTSEILALLQSMNERMTRLEELRVPPPPGGAGATASREMGLEAPPPGARSACAYPMAPGVVQRPLSMLSPHRPAFGPGPCGGCPAASTQAGTAGDLAYSTSVTAARRLLGGAPPGLPHVNPGLPESAGVPAARAKGGENVLRGATDQQAINLALVEALDRIGRGRRSGEEMEESFDEILNSGEADIDSLKLTGARGAAAMAKIARSIERDPERWIQHLDLQAYRACGSEETGLPWSMALYGERHIRFGKLETHERAWHMLSSLHSLSRTGQWTLLSARLGQYLKALEQSVSCGGSWGLAWPLTGLAPLRGGGQGLAHHSEYAAGIAYLKDMSALNDAMRKSETPGAPSGGSSPPGTGGGKAGGRGRKGPPPKEDAAKSS